MLAHFIEFIVTKEFSWLGLVLSIDENGWREFNITSHSVVSENIVARGIIHINIAKLDRVSIHGFRFYQFFPLRSHLFAGGALGRNECDHPHIIIIRDNLLTESSCV